MLQINYNSYYQVFTPHANVHLLLLIGNVLILTPLILTLSVLCLFHMCIYSIHVFLYVRMQGFTYVCIVCGRLRLIPDFIHIALVPYSLRQDLSIRPREQQYDCFHQSAYSWESLISACKARLEECTIFTLNVSSVHLKSSPRFAWQEFL